MMGRRTRAPIEARKCYFYVGDWLALDEILAPTKVKPTEFIRELVHRKIKEIRNKQAAQHIASVELPDDQPDDLTDFAPLPSESEQP